MSLIGMRRPGLGLGFELRTNINAQTGADGGGSFSFNTSFSDISSGLFGGATGVSGSGTAKESTDVAQTEQIEIDEEGLLLLIDKALKGTGGIAEIFGAEAGAGLFGSSAAKDQTEDLLAKIAGELALVTGKKTSTNVGTKDTVSTQNQSTVEDGLFDSIGLSKGGVEDIAKKGIEGTVSLFTGGLF